jgi:restriction endonuclease S subunit
LENCSLSLNPIGSLLIAMYGANIGETGILEIEATTNQAVCACKTYAGIENNYLLYLLTALKSNFISQGAGAAQPNISRDKIIRTVVPLPPLAEQKRIVTKIDQLMTLCNTLAQQVNNSTDKQTAILDAVLAKI